MFKDIFKMLKVNHYIKNVIVFVPLFFSMNFYNIELVIKSFIIFFAFCAISSAVYILNDIIDLNKDKLHPIKKNRPIASGRITIPYALFIMLIGLIFATTLAFKLNPLCLSMIISYFILNIFYSTILKNIALIDAASIALGFIMRIVSGCFAISVIPSPLVVLLTLFMSMFFTYSKRKLELQINKDSSRESLKHFDIGLIKQFILLNAVLSIAFYITYTLDATTITKAHNEFIYLTAIPFSLIVFRLLFLVNMQNAPDDPMYFIENDTTLKCLIVLYFIVLFVILCNPYLSSL